MMERLRATLCVTIDGGMMNVMSESTVMMAAGTMTQTMMNFENRLTFCTTSKPTTSSSAWAPSGSGSPPAGGVP